MNYIDDFLINNGAGEVSKVDLDIEGVYDFVLNEPDNEYFDRAKNNFKKVNWENRFYD